MALDSTNTLGKYQILREVARSNDIVYEAIDPALGRRVALKELYLPPNLTGAQKRERIERFLREGKAAGQLAHPNIVTIYDVGQQDDRFYIAMEFLEGQTLRDVLQMRGALPVKEAVDIALALCSALGYAHRNNVVHRDVKPENVQILPGGHVKLTDFGIARIMSEPSITADGQVFGTPSYMSPEQVSGKGIDGRSDIFSLGVMLYEMLAGQKPFSGDTVVTITYNIMNSEPAPPSGVPPYLIGIIRKAMAKDANMRYQNIEDMAEDLKNAPQNGTVTYNDPFAASYQPVASQTTCTPPSTYPQSQSQSPGPQPAPDPFAQAPATTSSPGVVLPAPIAIPREPLLSPETRAFLGWLLLSLGLVGLLFLAIWATNQAYIAYSERTITELAIKHINQGDMLMAEGKTEAAMIQYAEARRIAGDAKAGAKARRKLAEAYVRTAEDSLKTGSSSLSQIADLIVSADPDYSAGYYYRGVAYYRSHNQEYDKELRLAIKLGGNDQYAIAARKQLCNIYLELGDKYRAAGQNDQAKVLYQRILDDKDIYDPQFAQVAQERLAGL